MIALQSYDPLHYGVLSSDDIFNYIYDTKRKVSFQHIFRLCEDYLQIDDSLNSVMDIFYCFTRQSNISVA